MLFAFLTLEKKQYQTARTIMKSRTLLFLLLLVVVAGVAGCKPANPDGRVDVYGTITLNGKPITDGAWSIVLKSTSTNHDDGGGGPVYKGKIYLTGRNAPKPGTYRVCLTGIRYIDKKTQGPITAKTDPADWVTLKMLPDEFLTDSNIEFEVVKGKRNVFNHNIVTEFQPQQMKGRK
jgi:hypothetical protein